MTAARPQSMTHKILARAAGLASVEVGQIVDCKIDMCFTHDPVLAGLREYFYDEFGKSARVWDPDRVALFQDHLVPAKDTSSRMLAKAMDDFAAEQGLKHYYPYGANYGICHVVMCEKGHVVPGQVVIGTDSHSVTYGAFNAFGSGIGMVDLANVLLTGELWFRVPEVIEIRIEGELPDHLMAKDVILRIVGDLTMSGASGKTIEFTGSTIDAMTAEERMTLCNMVVEAGAKNGIMALNEAARRYLREAGVTSWEAVTTDPGFEYARKLHYRADQLRPMVAYPHRPDNVHTIDEAKQSKIKVDQVYIGSCTGAKLEDLRAFAAALGGDRVADHVRLIVVPASMHVYRTIVGDGVAARLMAAGAVVESPGCKACYGAHGGVPGNGEVCLSTTNRNFRGRMGNPSSEVYLCSPRVAAKSAVAGYITDTGAE